jgi:Xaa-Pro aminopeptidase
MIAMGVHFGPEFFAGNRQRLQTLFAGSAPIVISGNGLLQRNSDINYPFRQDSSFWYLTGIDEAGVVLVLDKGKEYLILPERGRAQEALDSDVDPAKLAHQSGIPTVLHHKDGWKQLSSRLKKVKHIATLGAAPAYIDIYGMYTNPARAALIARMKEISPQVKLLDLREHLTRMRMIKQPQELKVIQKAIDITCGALKKVTANLGRYGYEYELEAAIEYEFRKRGATGLAFDTMVAAGSHASSPHHMDNNGPMPHKGLLLVDTGAEVSNYAGDISRTYALGTPTKRQQTIYQTVQEVQSYAYSRLKPGVVIRDYEHEIEHYMGEKLRSLGLIKTVEREAIRSYYPHATSHSLGLDAHDAADYDRPLEAGFILTVEPGIYIPEEGIGVRLEDVVLITPKGYKILSNKLPQKLG